jgi:hypothetical protein
MFKRLKNMLLIGAATLTMGAVSVGVPATAFAATCNPIQTSINSGLVQAGGSGSNTTCGASAGASGGLTNLAKKVVNIFSILVGIVAVIMIIYGGFRYITSGGDSGNVGNAKNTLIFAIVGLIIVALAQFIVHYVLNTAVNAT